MKSKKPDEPKRVPKNATPSKPRTQAGPTARPKASAPSRGVPGPKSLSPTSSGPKITLYRHTTAPRFGDPQLDKIASDITHGLAKRSGKVIVPLSTIAAALRTSKNAKWRSATPIQWSDAVLSFLLKSLAHRTKLLTYKAEGASIVFKAVWRMPTN